MSNCKDLYKMCLNSHYKNVFNTTWVELVMTVIAKEMILNGLY